MKKITILLFAVAALGSGCKKFTNINNNPNQPTAVTPNVLLSAALTGSASEIGTGFFNTPRWMGYWARSGNYIATPPVEDYLIDVGYADGDWQTLYGVLNSYNNVENAGKANPTVLSFYIGVAQVMKALHFSTLVDAFNNVPYSQAFNLNKYPTPKYDAAADIYASLIAQCDSSVAFFDNAKAYYDAGGATASIDNQYDIVFGRNGSVSEDTRMDNWVKFANTVKLRLLLTEQGAVTSSYITTELAKTTANGRGYLMAGTSASVNPGYSNAQATQLNPFYSEFLNTAGATIGGYNFNVANQYAINFYQNTNDERVQTVYTTFSNNTNVGNYDGDPNSASDADVSGLEVSSQYGLLKSPSEDQFLISDFESLFMQAEAAQEGYIVGGTAADLGKAAIEQSYVYLGAPIADADAFISANAGNTLVDPSTGLKAIITQKWIALNGVNWEQSYTDFRRTGFPTQDGVNFGVTHAPNPVVHNGKVLIPFRYLYPQSEITTNAGSIPAGTNAYTPVFWDKREQ